MPDRLVTADTVAARLGVQADTVRRWALHGLIPVYRVGQKTLRFDIDEVLAAIRCTQDEGGGADGN